MARFKTTPNTSNAASTQATPQKVGRHAAHATHVANTENISRAPHSAQGTYNATRRPVDLPAAPSPSATGAFQVVSQSTSSSAERMRNYHDNGGVRQKQKPGKAPKGIVIGIVVAAIVVVLLLILLLSSFVAPSAPDTASTTAAAETVQTEASVEEGIVYHGYTYKARQDEGIWTLVSTNGSVENTIYSFKGTPVSIVFHEGMFYLAENLSDGTWDVITYMPMDGATATQLLDLADNPVVGTGTLESATIEDTNLVTVDTSGVKTYTSLV